MEIIDLTGSLSHWLEAKDPRRAFTDWVTELPPEHQLGFSGLGGVPSARPGDKNWELVVQRAMSCWAKTRGPLTDLIQSSLWREKIQETITRVEMLLGGPIDHVDVVLSVGLGARNASMGYWRGKGIAFLWLEHFLEPDADSGFLNLGTEAIPIWLGHEIAHAVRYGAPETVSPLAQAVEGKGPWDFSQALDSLPLAERILDEGLATAFSRHLIPNAEEGEVLGMSSAEIRWLEENSSRLVEDRRDRWDFAVWNPPVEWVRESLCYDPARTTSPWTIERPPGRWGYFVGYQYVRREPVTDRLRALTRSAELPGPNPST